MKKYLLNLQKKIRIKFVFTVFTMLITSFFLSSCSFLDKFTEKNKIYISGEKIDVINNIHSEKIKQTQTQINKSAKHISNVTLPEQIDYNDQTFSSRLGGYGNIRYNWPNNIKDIKKIIDMKVNNSYLMSFHSSPVITKDNKLMIVDKMGILYAFDAKNGKKLWTYDLIDKKRKIFDKFTENYSWGGGILVDYSVNVDSGIAYVTYGADSVFAFDVSTGKQIWRAMISSITRSTPLIVKDKLIIQSLNNTIYALDKKTGKVLWLNVNVIDGDVLSSIPATPILLDDSRVVVHSSQGAVRCLDTINGHEIWKIDSKNYDKYIKTQDLIYGFVPIIEHSTNTLYTIIDDGSILALNYETGAINWKKYMNVSKAFWIAGDYIYIVNGGGQIVGINKHNGNIIFANDLNIENIKSVNSEINNYDMLSSPVVVGDYIAIVRFDGVLFLYDMLTGELKKNIPVHIRSNMPITVKDNVFYVVSRSGNIVGYKNMVIK